MVRGGVGPLTWVVSARRDVCVCVLWCGGVRRCAAVRGGARRCRATHIGCVGSAWCLCMSV